MNRIAGFVNYYQYSLESKPYFLIAFGQGDLAYHGVNRDISVNTLNNLVSQSMTTTSIVTTLNQGQSNNWNNDQLNFINLMRQILLMLLNFFNNLRVN